MDRIFDERKPEIVYHLAANSDIQSSALNTDVEYKNTYSGGRLKKIAKYNIHVNIENMQITEDVHLILNHMMMYILSGMKGC